LGEEGTEEDLPGEKREDGPLSFLVTDTEPWGMESVKNAAKQRAHSREQTLD
jgi:hypothetical protein